MRLKPGARAAPEDWVAKKGVQQDSQEGEKAVYIDRVEDEVEDAAQPEKNKASLEKQKVVGNRTSQLALSQPSGLH